MPHSFKVLSRTVLATIRFRAFGQRLLAERTERIHRMRTAFNAAYVAMHWRNLTRSRAIERPLQRLQLHFRPSLPAQCSALNDLGNGPANISVESASSSVDETSSRRVHQPFQPESTLCVVCKYNEAKVADVHRSNRIYCFDCEPLNRENAGDQKRTFGCG